MIGTTKTTGVDTRDADALASARRPTDAGGAVVERIPLADESQADALLTHARRLEAVRDPHLVPVVSAFREGSDLLVSTPAVVGAPFSELLGRYSLTPAQALHVGLSALEGVGALQRAGLSHGALTADRVRVAKDGSVQLTGYALNPRIRKGTSRDPNAVAIGWPDPKTDLTAVGALLCAALGLDRSERENGAAGVPTALALTARALANGRLGRDANAARGMLADSAGGLASPTSTAKARSEIGFLAATVGGPIAASVSSVVSPRPESVEGPPPAVGARQASAARAAAAGSAAAPPRPTRFVSAAAAGAAARPSARPTAPPSRSIERLPAMPRRRNWPLLAALAAFGILLLLAFVSQLGVFSYGRTSAGLPPAAPKPATPAASPVQSSAASAAPSTPAPAPASAPTVAAPAVPVGRPVPAASTGSLPASPTGSVQSFYQFVVAHNFGAAANLWSASMRSTYPPPEYINGRFANTLGITINSMRLVSENQSAGTASVYVDLTEYQSGATYHWYGTWDLVNYGSGWELNSPHLSGGQVAGASGQADGQGGAD